MALTVALEASSGYVITVIDENRYSIVVLGESHSRQH